MCEHLAALSEIARIDEVNFVSFFMYCTVIVGFLMNVKMKLVILQ